jgi:hypothetical protein
MNDSAFWNSLAARFRQLSATDPIVLRAEFSADDLSHWRIAGFGQDIEPFKRLAKLCAVSLGAKDNVIAWTDWLDRLTRDSSDFKAEPLKSPRDVIQGIGDLSARFCEQLDLEARTSALAPPRSDYPDRAVWLRAKMNECGYTENRLEVLTGVDGKTLTKALAGKTVTAAVMAKIAKGFSENGHPVSVSDIPSS